MWDFFVVFSSAQAAMAVHRFLHLLNAAIVEHFFDPTFLLTHTKSLKEICSLIDCPLRRFQKCVGWRKVSVNSNKQGKFGS